MHFLWFAVGRRRCKDDEGEEEAAYLDSDEPRHALLVDVVGGGEFSIYLFLCDLRHVKDLVFVVNW